MTGAKGGNGIIPAYAGSTPRRQDVAALYRDHPRVCGEHEITDASDSAQKGSSPRMRGARRRARGVARAGGIIPAYAGSTGFHI